MSLRPLSSLSLFTRVDIGIFVIAATVLFTVYLRQRNRDPYPPGPKGLPIIGNILDIPEKKPWVAYRDWSRKMDSPVIRLNAMGTTIIVVNDRNTAVDLFEKRGAVYSDRPRMPMMNEACGFAFNFALINDAHQWKMSRRGFDIFFRKANVQQFREHEMTMIRSLLTRLLDSPERYVHHIHYMTASMIVDVTYGIQAKPQGDHFIEIAETALRGLEKSTNMSIIDILPWVQHVPSWLPGMGWKKKVDLLKKQTLQMADVPYEWVRSQLEKGLAKPCVVTDLVSRFEEEISDHSEREYTIKSIAGTVYAAGADTTVSALHSLFLAMTLFPEVQKHAQADIDRVVGSERMPEFADQDNLPYITAVMKEVLRWAAPTPLAVPHASAKADSYKGYYIPKGAIVLGNSWAMLHDPATYPDPEEFKPSRFLTSDGALDPAVPDPEVTFGFGRHLCPGRFMALESMWITMVCILATFNIERTKGDDGRPLPMPEELFASGIMQQPNPFPCTVTPRSDASVNLIRI